jgi:hypothetical protein
MCSLIALSTKKNVAQIRSRINQHQTFTLGLARTYTCSPTTRRYSARYARQLGQCGRYGVWLWAGRPRGRSSSPCRVTNFLFSTSSRPALVATQPPIQHVPGALSPGVKRRDVTLMNHFQLVPGSRKRGSTHPLFHKSS